MGYLGALKENKGILPVERAVHKCRGEPRQMLTLRIVMAMMLLMR